METAHARTAAGNGSEIWRAGIASGLLAAVAMMAFMAGAAALDGASDALDPLRSVGTGLRGRDASRAGAGTLVWGVVLHLAVGAGLGLAFSAIVPRDLSVAAGAVLGAGCALLAMGFALSVVVPPLAPVLHARMPAHGGAWVIAHALFGAIAGLGPSLRRRMGERAGRGAPDARARVLRPRTSS